ncbi:MAG: amidohydrolase [Bacillaceae bacterium]|nr:amidohydrolase [Bacillaceae bacterium]
MSVHSESMVAKAGTIANQLVEWRRTLHQNPELSFQEYETSEMVARLLRQIPGMQVQTGIAGTGVVGVLTTGKGPVIGIRADMDALPICEQADHDYCSRRPGVMHACGHDAHTSILLGTAYLLADYFHKGRLSGTVKFIFQPAEEAPDENGLSGAPYMIRAGVLEDVDAVLALHMDPENPVGTARVHDGFSMANVDVFRGKITGTGGHAAYPHLGTDPVWMLGPVLQAINGIVSRRVSPLDEAVVSITQIHAGTASNVIPTEVELEGTLRSYKPDVREFLIRQVENAFALVSNLGGNYQVEVIRGEPALNNHPLINQWLTQTIQDLFPGFHIKNEPFGLGGEDFGHMTQVVPGAMFFLGCAFNDDVPRELHTPVFDIDEKCLPVGAAIMAETALRFLSGEYFI